MGLKSAGEIRRESANDIGARSVKAAIKPDIKLQPTRQSQNNGSLANGMRSYKISRISNVYSTNLIKFFL